MTPAILKDQAPTGWKGWIGGAILIAFALQLELCFSRPVNWDEFYHLSQAHAFHRGELAEAMQVFHARAFFWLPLLPLDIIDQIRVARLFMLGCEAFVTLAILATATRFAGRYPAALAALAYVTGGYVFQHGFSYRADPIAAALVMGALWIVLASRLRAAEILAAALLAGLAALTTVKMVFYAPAFAGIAWLRWHQAAHRRDMLCRLAAFCAGSALFAALLIGAAGLDLAADAGGRASGTLAFAGSTMFDEGLFPRWRHALGATMAAPLLALLVIAAPWALVRAQLPRPQAIAVAAMMLPLASIAIYRNSYPYYYAFILPPAMAGAALSARFLASRVRPDILACAFLVNAAMLSLTTPRPVLSIQQGIVGAVHEIFPEPVAYIDAAGMIADFPQAGFFMSTWGMRRYCAGLEPSLLAAMTRQTVPLLLLDRKVLERNQGPRGPASELRPADAAALRENFIPHWGPIWVAGRHFPAGTGSRAFTILAPGVYTVEGQPARLDGLPRRSGETIVLARGTHRFEGQGETVLRWGDHLDRPARPYSGGPVFTDFRPAPRQPEERRTCPPRP